MPCLLSFVNAIDIWADTIYVFFTIHCDVSSLLGSAHPFPPALPTFHSKFS